MVAVTIFRLSVYTRDSGKSWEHVKSARNTDYFARCDISAPGTDKIITVGRNGIYYSEDKGKSWQIQVVENNKKKLRFTSLNTVCFINNNDGWIAGAEGEPVFEKGGANGKAVILKTSDGGKTWEMKKLEIKGMINKIHFFDKNNGWAIGKSVKNNDDAFILYTSNDGNNWKEFDFHDNAFPLDAYFVNSDNGWLVGKKGAIYKYKNK